MQSFEHNVKLVIVVPVFNTENYLLHFFEELKNQSFKDFHVYAVNDGSTDSSLEMLEKWKNEEKRLTVINQKNQGVSSARNCALDLIEKSKVKYKYIYFCDSDDYLERDALEKVITAMERSDADYGLFSVRKVYKNTYVTAKQKIFSRVNLTKADILKQYFRYGFTWRKEPCSEAFLNNKIFRYDVVKTERFDEELKRSEDFEFFMKVFNKIEKGILVPDAWFNYRMRSSSLTHSVRNSGDFRACLNLFSSNQKRTSLEKRFIQHKFWRAAYLEIFNENKRIKDIFPNGYQEKLYPPIFVSDIKLLFVLFIIPPCFVEVLRRFRFLIKSDDGNKELVLFE